MNKREKIGYLIYAIALACIPIGFFWIPIIYIQIFLFIIAIYLITG
jgi:hypothetical protein